MKILEALRRPVIRIPLVIALMVSLGAIGASWFRGEVDSRGLAVARRLRCIEVVSRAALESAEAGRRPKSLAELVGTPQLPGVIETLYMREYAALPEFTDPRGGGKAGGLPAIEVRGAELLWDGWCYQLWPSPKNDRDFVIFTWPEAGGVGRLTWAFLSTDPGTLYCTFAISYAGRNGGPEPSALGKPFDGVVNVMEGVDPRNGDEILERASKSGGKLWAKMQVKPADAAKPRAPSAPVVPPTPEAPAAPGTESGPKTPASP